MKKFLASIVLAFVAVVTFAQTNPTRLFVRDTAGSLKGFLVERIDSIFFYDVEGQAKVDITFHELKLDDPENPVIICSFKPSEVCGSFRFVVLPKPKADALTSASVAAKYLEDVQAPSASGNYDHAEMTGFDFPFTPGAPYAIIAVAYDLYGVACEMSRVDFEVPAAEIEGKPAVNYNIDNKTEKTVTITMTPNDDCTEYYVCLYGEGEFEAQYNQWAPMMGFTCEGDMVKAWGANPETKLPYYGEATHTWNGLNPGTTYDIYIQPCDANGNYGDLIKFQVTTNALGGEGLSEISIEVGKFDSYTDDQGNVNYLQQVIYTPNDQTNLHRDMLIEKAAIGSADFPNEDAIIEYLKTDNPYDPYQNQFGVDDVQWTVKADTEYIAYAIGQNAIGEWGTLAKKELKTPAAKSSAKAVKTAVVTKRHNAKANNNVTLPGGFVIKKNLMIK